MGFPGNNDRKSELVVHVNAEKKTRPSEEMENRKLRGRMQECVIFLFMSCVYPYSAATASMYKHPLPQSTEREIHCGINAHPGFLGSRLNSVRLQLLLRQ